MTPAPARGEVWWCELPEIGRRPVVVLSRDAAIHRRRCAIVAPGTTNIRALASEVVLDPAEDPIPRRSAVNLDSVESVPTATLVERLGRLGDQRMRDGGDRWTGSKSGSERTDGDLATGNWQLAEPPALISEGFVAF